MQRHDPADKAPEMLHYIPLMFLARSLTNMSLCHAAYFCKGWKNARGCIIEHAVAEAYGLTILYEEGDE